MLAGAGWLAVFSWLFYHLESPALCLAMAMYLCLRPRRPGGPVDHQTCSASLLGAGSH